MKDSTHQSPFDAPFATPDVGGTGLNGMGNAFSADSGPQGIVNTPYTEAAIPLSIGTSATPCADLGQPGPAFVQVDGGSPGENMPWDVTSSRNTVDKK
jgi:hypothetical protein